MTTTRQQKRDAFLGAIAEAIDPAKFPWEEICGAADKFMKLARTLERINVRECNGYSSPNPYFRADLAEAKDRVARARTEARLKDLCRHYGFGLNLGGDPRGFAVKLILPTGRYNTWGGKEEGYGVPT